MGQPLQRKLNRNRKEFSFVRRKPRRKSSESETALGERLKRDYLDQHGVTKLPAAYSRMGY